MEAVLVLGAVGRSGEPLGGMRNVLPCSLCPSRSRALSGARWVPSVVGCAAQLLRAELRCCSPRHKVSTALTRYSKAQLNALPWKGRSRWRIIGVSALYPSCHLRVVFFLYPLWSAESYEHLGFLSYDHRVRRNECFLSVPFHVVAVCFAVWLWVWWEWWAGHSGKRNIRHRICRTRSEQSSQNCY